MLEKRRLGRTGLVVSLLGFGGIPIMRVTAAEATAVIGEALKRGVDFFDSARGYADSEKKIGLALKAHAATPVLASKSPKRDRAGMREDVLASLSDLGVDAIDLYQLHGVSRREDYDRVMAAEGAYTALSELRSEGRVRHVGISTHNLEIADLAIRSGMFETVQILFNVIEDEAAEKVIPAALRHDVGVIAMKPFGGGYIEQHDLALRWVLAHPGVVAIPGVATAGEVQRNVAVAEGKRELSAEDLAAAAAIKDTLGRNFCRRCDYCQPCPHDVPISFLLQVRSISRRMGEPLMRTDSWRDILRRAVACDQCGACEERCPFALPIRELLSDARQNLSEILE
jgi:predicted aldo/keto reductase-like oxidoreductase